MRGGRFTHPKLKKVEAGEYLYDGRYSITCLGYDRIRGSIVWSVSTVCRRVAQGESLKDAVYQLERVLAENKKAK